MHLIYPEWRSVMHRTDAIIDLVPLAPWRLRARGIGKTARMPSLWIAGLVGLAALFITFKVLKMAMTAAFLVAAVAAGVAGYLTYVAT